MTKHEDAEILALLRQMADDLASLREDMAEVKDRLGALVERGTARLRCLDSVGDGVGEVSESLCRTRS